jgi:CubicO group peptidase (beta-lactamase class C family)
MGDKKMKLRYLIFIYLLTLTPILYIQPIKAQAIEDSERKRTEWPNTRAACFAKAFFKAYNTDGDDALRQFVKEHHSEDYLKENLLEDELAHHLMLKKIAGKLTVHSASAEGDFTIEVIAHSKLFGGWMKFQIELSPESPHDPTKFMGGPTDPPEAENVQDYSDWNDFRGLLEMVHRDSGTPGIAASIVQSGNIVEKAVTGVRRIDRKNRIQINDRFHLGSVGKTFTGTMIGKLLDEEVLRWEMTIGEVLSDIPMKGEYRNVTLEQLLGHRGGVPSVPAEGEFADGFPAMLKRSSVEARAALVRQVLTEEQVNSGEYIYSNAGYVVAAYMVEREMKRSWEELMRTLVFKPLGLQTVGFGWPATENRPHQPLGHNGAPPELSVQEIGELPKIGDYVLGDLDYIGPAGNLHCSIEDLARFATFLLRVLDGRDSSLKAETVPRFWRVGKTDEGEGRYCFFGSGGTFFAMIALYPESDLAVVAAANSGLHAWPFMEKLRDAVYQRMKKSPGGFSEQD